MNKSFKTFAALLAAATISQVALDAGAVSNAFAAETELVANKEDANGWRKLAKNVYLRAIRTNPDFFTNFDSEQFMPAIAKLVHTDDFTEGSWIEMAFPKGTPAGTQFVYNPQAIDKAIDLGFSDDETQHMMDVRMKTFPDAKTYYYTYYYSKESDSYIYVTNEKNTPILSKDLDTAKSLKGPDGESPAIVVGSNNNEDVYYIFTELPSNASFLYLDFWTDPTFRKGEGTKDNVELWRGTPKHKTKTQNVGFRYISSQIPEPAQPILDEIIECPPSYESIPFETERRENPNLDQGEERVIQEGVEGLIEITMSQKIVNGEPVGNPFETDRSVVKEPINEIIEYGTKVPDIEDIKTSSIEKEIPYETQIVEDPELEEGERKVVQEGVPGLKEIITNQPLLNGEPNGAPEVIENIKQEPVDEIIHVGTGKVGEVIEEAEEPIPYQTIYQHNKELPAGERRTIQEGVLGKKKVTTTQKTFNDEPVGAPTIVEDILEEPVDEIIEIGSGVTDESVTTVDKVIPFETERVENPDLPKGEERVVQKGEPGKLTITTVQPRFNGEPVGEPTVSENVVKDPVKEIIEVGTKESEQKTDLSIEEIPFETRREEDPELPKGEERVIQKGIPGKVKITTTQEFVNGEPVGEPIIVREVVIEPTEEIIHVGTKEESPVIPEEDTPAPTPEESIDKKVTIEKIPFETERRESDKLPKGKERVIQAGEEGIKETRTSQKLVDGKPVGEPTVVETVVKKPVKEIIEVGLGVQDVEVKEVVEEIPFETERVLNKELKEGEERVKVEGVVGQKRITTTTKTLDGKPVGQPEVKEEVVKEPVKKIIEYGEGVPVEDQQKADVKTGIEDLSTNPTLLTTIGLSLTGVLAALGIRRYKNKSESESK